MENPPPLPSAPPLENAASATDIPVVDRDLNCLVCRYNLRTLTHDATCPECETPVLWAVHGDMPVHAKPFWITILFFGAAMMSLSLFMMFGVEILQFRGLDPDMFSRYAKVAFAMLAIGGIFLAWPQRDPSVSHAGQYYRICLLLGCLIFLLVVALQPKQIKLWEIMLQSHQQRNHSVLRAIVIALINKLCEMHRNLFLHKQIFRLVFALGLVYLRRISERIPAKNLQFYIWVVLGMVLFLIWFFSAIYGAMMMRWPIPDWLWNFQDWMWMATYLGTGVLYALYAQRLWRARTLRLSLFSADLKQAAIALTQQIA